MLSFLESLPPPGTTSVLCSLGNSSQGASAKPRARGGKTQQPASQARKPKKKGAVAQARCKEVVDASGDVALGSVLAHLGEMRVRPAAQAAKSKKKKAVAKKESGGVGNTKKQPTAKRGHAGGKGEGEVGAQGGRARPVVVGALPSLGSLMMLPAGSSSNNPAAAALRPRAGLAARKKQQQQQQQKKKKQSATSAATPVAHGALSRRAARQPAPQSSEEEEEEEEQQQQQQEQCSDASSSSEEEEHVAHDPEQQQEEEQEQEDMGLDNWEESEASEEEEDERKCAAPAPAPLAIDIAAEQQQQQQQQQPDDDLLCDAAHLNDVSYGGDLGNSVTADASSTEEEEEEEEEGSSTDEDDEQHQSSSPPTTTRTLRRHRAAADGTSAAAAPPVLAIVEPVAPAAAPRAPARSTAPAKSPAAAKARAARVARSPAAVALANWRTRSPHASGPRRPPHRRGTDGDDDEMVGTPTPQQQQQQQQQQQRAAKHTPSGSAARHSDKKKAATPIELAKYADWKANLQRMFGGESAGDATSGADDSSSGGGHSPSDAAAVDMLEIECARAVSTRHGSRVQLNDEVEEEEGGALLHETQKALANLQVIQCEERATAAAGSCDERRASIESDLEEYEEDCNSCPGDAYDTDNASDSCNGMDDEQDGGFAKQSIEDGASSPLSQSPIAADIHSPAAYSSLSAVPPAAAVDDMPTPTQQHTTNTGGPWKGRTELVELVRGDALTGDALDTFALPRQMDSLLVRMIDDGSGGRGDGKGCALTMGAAYWIIGRGLRFVGLTFAADRDAAAARPEGQAGSSESDGEEEEEEALMRVDSCRALVTLLNHGVQVEENCSIPSAVVAGTVQHRGAGATEKSSRRGSMGLSEAEQKQVLPGVVAVVDVRAGGGLGDASETVAEQLRGMGAKVMKKMGPKVTHVVWHAGCAKLLRAAERKTASVKTVNPLWVQGCANAGSRLTEDVFTVSAESAQPAASAEEERVPAGSSKANKAKKASKVSKATSNDVDMLPKALASKKATPSAGVSVAPVAAAKKSKAPAKKEKNVAAAAAAPAPTYRTRSGRNAPKRVLHNIADPPTPEAMAAAPATASAETAAASKTSAPLSTTPRTPASQRGGVDIDARYAAWQKNVADANSYSPASPDLPTTALAMARFRGD